MEQTIVGTVLLVLGGLYAVRPDLVMRFQIWVQRVVLGAKYEPSGRTYKIMRVLGAGFVIFGLVIIVSAQGQKPIAAVDYECNEGKTISAVFYEGEAAEAEPSEPPQPGGWVELKLSDGREMTLKQTISASGIRYSDGDPMIEGSEHFVFWSKGEMALVLEDNVEKTYIGCVEKDI